MEGIVGVSGQRCKTSDPHWCPLLHPFAVPFTFYCHPFIHLNWPVCPFVIFSFCSSLILISSFQIEHKSRKQHVILCFHLTLVQWGSQTSNIWIRRNRFKTEPVTLLCLLNFNSRTLHSQSEDDDDEASLPVRAWPSQSSLHSSDDWWVLDTKTCFHTVCGHSLDYLTLSLTFFPPSKSQRTSSIFRQSD